MGDLSALDAHIARVRGLGSLAREAAPEVAEALEDEAKRQIAAGTDPDGKSWQERRDGGKPLATAANSLAVVPVGTRIFMRLRGHVARHHKGIAKGGVERQILPKRLTPRMAGVVKGAVGRVFERLMGAGRG